MKMTYEALMFLVESIYGDLVSKSVALLTSYSSHGVGLIRSLEKRCILYQNVNVACHPPTSVLCHQLVYLLLHILSVFRVVTKVIKNILCDVTV